jgi:hypothetical protein
VSQALKMILPFSFIDVEGSESTLSRRVNKYIERYIRLVLEDPSNVEAVAVKLLNDEEAMLLLASKMIDSIRRETEASWRSYLGFLGTVEEKFRDAGIDVGEALEVVVEHDEWKLRSLMEDLPKYTDIMAAFFVNYRDEAERYLVVSFALLLLLISSLKAETPQQLRAIGEKLAGLANELESYLVTFMLMEEDYKVEGEFEAARSPEELRKVLGVE